MEKGKKKQCKPPNLLRKDLICPGSLAENPKARDMHHILVRIHDIGKVNNPAEKRQFSTRDKKSRRASPSNHLFRLWFLPSK